MNFIDQNNSLMKSLHHLFQSQWTNPFQVMPSISTCYSPFSSSTSFTSPVKSEGSDQEEPLNLSLKYTDNQTKANQPSSVINPYGVMSSLLLSQNIPMMIPHILQRSSMLPNITKPEPVVSGFVPILFNNSDQYQKQNRKSNSIKKKKSRCFKCNQCRMVFTCLASLSEHTQTNHGGYKCHICETSFTQRSNLQRHALRHVGFRPYKCGVCAKEYYRKDHLIRHISFNHPLVNAKDSIIQRLSSSESLNFIDNKIEMESKYDDNDISALRSHSTEFSEMSNEDTISIKKENVFLKSEMEQTEWIDVDI